MVLGEKHGTNYLPYTFFLVYNEKERKRKERQPFQIWIELTEEIIQRMQSEKLFLRSYSRNGTPRHLNYYQQAHC